MSYTDVNHASVSKYVEPEQLQSHGAPNAVQLHCSLELW